MRLATLGVWGLLLPAMAAGVGRVGAQTVHIIPTRHNGDPFKEEDIQRKFTTGETFSINVVVDTRDTLILIDAIAVSLRFPSGRIKKDVRYNGAPTGSGWPLQQGIPIISNNFDLPASLRPLMGGNFLAISGSTENVNCPCYWDNGPGMESVIHFLVVDLRREKALPPGLYHMFQTDWIVRQDCRIEDLDIEVSDGERGRGLLGAFGEPLPNYILDKPSEQVLRLGNGLTAFGTGSLRVICRSDLHFIRGDTTADGKLGIVDALEILTTMFVGGNPACELAGDVDDNGEIEINDPLYLLRFLFIGAAPIPPPHPECGLGPVRNALLCRIRCAGE